MPLTYRCEIYAWCKEYETEASLDEDGICKCGDENIRHDCLWGRWTTLDDAGFREKVRRLG